MNRFLTLAVLGALVASCGSAGPSSSASAMGSPTDRDEPMPVVIDTDLGADDMVALAILLHDPAVDVGAITVAGTGLGHCAPGMRNLRGLLHQLGIDGLPIGCGTEDAGRDGRPFPDPWRAGTDAGYQLTLPPVPGSQGGGDAVDVLTHALSAAAEPVTLVVLGPWTNLADLFAARPDLVERVAQIHAMGGTLDAPGNVLADDGTSLEPSMEWNLAADPSAVADVLALGIPTRFVALDATDQLPVDHALYDRLRTNTSAAGANLAFELLARNTYMLDGGNFLWDQLAALTVSDPDLVTWDRIGIAVEVEQPSGGHIERSEGGMEVQISTDVAVTDAWDAFFLALGRGGPRPDQFEVTGRIEVVWDGSTCAAPAPREPGIHEVVLTNTTDARAGGAYVHVSGGHTWDEFAALLADYDPAQEDEMPAWVAPVAFLQADIQNSATAIGEIPAGLVGPVCWIGGPDELPTFTLGLPHAVGD